MRPAAEVGEERRGLSMQDSETKRKRLRLELLRWHPDKFMGKFGSRLREGDREAIMAQVKDIAHQLHDATKAHVQS